MASNLPAKITHVVGTNKLCRLEDVYDDIGEICGIKSLDGEAPPAGAETVSINYLVQRGIARRAKVRLANKKIRTIYIIAANCPQIGALEGKEYTSNVLIKTAYFPQKVNFTAV